MEEPLLVRYYIMRHAVYYDFENQFVSYWGMLALKASMDKLKNELREKFPNSKKLRIIHSTLPRAKHTALLMEDILANIKVFRRSDPNLNSDKLLINQKYIEEVVSACEKEQEICLILSHKPDIKYFCDQEIGSSQYLLKDIIINREKPDENKDDLPF